MTADHQPLSDPDLEVLLGSLRGPGSQRVAKKASPALVHGVHHVSFESHPLYRQMKMQRDFAKLLEIKDPYYRNHAARAGATVAPIAPATSLQFRLHPA